MTRQSGGVFRALRISAVTLVCAGLGLAAPSPAGAVDHPQLEILSPETVEVSAGKTDTASVLVRNDGKPPAEVEFRVDAAENAP